MSPQLETLWHINNLSNKLYDYLDLGKMMLNGANYNLYIIGNYVTQLPNNTEVYAKVTEIKQ
ncbi:MAG: hypothetical protein K2X04_09625 [Burkholderiales bacterium]|nr:hypothetical protein [Burkholderiales bacterium]